MHLLRKLEFGLLEGVLELLFAHGDTDGAKKQAKLFLIVQHSESVLG